MSQIDEIVEFLNARYDEEWTLASDASCNAYGIRYDHARFGDEFESHDGEYTGDQIAFVTRHDPMYVFDDITAKRKILALHQPAEAFSSSPNLRHCASCSTPDWFENPHWVDWPCRTLLLLASQYDRHTDYREEWRP